MQLLDAAAGRAADKAMRHLLPWLLLMYMLAFLDRANLGFDRIDCLYRAIPRVLDTR